MVNGIYTAGESMKHLQRKQDVAANNLANSATKGFKFSRLLTETEVEVKHNVEGLLHQDESQKLNEVYTSFEQGPLVNTGNTLDIGIHGKGFFAIDTADGVRYTRNGSFALNDKGQLVTLSGDPVMREDGKPFSLSEQGGSQIDIMADGSVFTKGLYSGKIKVVQFEDTRLLKSSGQNYYEDVALTHNIVDQPEPYSIKQRFLEGSNVNVIAAMVDMVAQHKNYESSQKALQASDETLDKAVNEIGRVT